jgi:hypothetical protein
MPTYGPVARRIVWFIAISAATAILVRPLIEAGLDAWDRRSMSRRGR